jgi:hypothetical protein
MAKNARLTIVEVIQLLLLVRHNDFPINCYRLRKLYQSAQSLPMPSTCQASTSTASYPPRQKNRLKLSPWRRMHPTIHSLLKRPPHKPNAITSLDALPRRSRMVSMSIWASGCRHLCLSIWRKVSGCGCRARTDSWGWDRTRRKKSLMREFLG